MLYIPFIFLKNEKLVIGSGISVCKMHQWYRDGSGWLFFSKFETAPFIIKINLFDEVLAKKRLNLVKTWKVPGIFNERVSRRPVGIAVCPPICLFPHTFIFILRMERDFDMRSSANASKRDWLCLKKIMMSKFLNLDPFCDVTDPQFYPK